MYYKFSGFTRALTGASAPGAYSPQGLRPGGVADSPAIVFGSQIKHASESGAAPEFLGKNRVPDLQKLFQKSNGFPVHVKRGLPDQLLYRTTMALTVGGALYCLVALYMAAQPRNKKGILD